MSISNARADRYALLSTKYLCPQCKKQAITAAITLTAGHFVRESAEEGWTAADGGTVLLSNIVDLNYDAMDVLRSAGAPMSMDMSFSSTERYLMNHCEHCGAKFGDYYLVTPGRVFNPLSHAEAALISLKNIVGPLEAEADWVTASNLHEFLFKEH